MTSARSEVVIEGEEAIYHCTSRCVRRAYLYGVDPLTGTDYSHRKDWIKNCLKLLVSLFTIRVLLQIFTVGEKGNQATPEDCTIVRCSAFVQANGKSIFDIATNKAGKLTLQTSAPRATAKEETAVVCVF